MVPLPVRVVLCRPRNPENLGAAARALKNFGVTDWAIVDPRTHDFAAARRVAVHAEELLDTPRIVSTLDEAVGDCVWVVGTSSRSLRGKRRLGPREVAREAEARAPGRTAIVFGDERSGLSNAEIERCHDLSAIPTAPEQPSLNLAQALVVYCHAIHEQAIEAREPPPLPRAATDTELVHLEESLRGMLRRSGFLTSGPAGDDRHAPIELMASLRRGRLTRREAELWRAALRATTKRLPEPPPSPEPAS